MPKEVKELEDSNVFLRGKLLSFLRRNSGLAYTLRELHEMFLRDTLGKKYRSNPKTLYHLIYGYLREFRLGNKIVKKGNYYYFKK